MKKLQKIFDESLKNYADTRELDYKKAVSNSIKERDIIYCDYCDQELSNEDIDDETVGGIYIYKCGNCGKTQMGDSIKAQDFGLQGDYPYKQELNVRSAYVESGCRTINRYGPHKHSLTNLEHDMYKIIQILKTLENRGYFKDDPN